MLAHRDDIVMLKDFFIDPLLIQKGAITTLQILNKIIIAMLSNLGVKARYRKIINGNAYIAMTICANA